uniref:Uncharacterized protein n=1 Tax=Ascaris lumbricoides TaxID=6252 RepID=A0A0M3IGL3_ASCLU
MGVSKSVASWPDPRWNRGLMHAGSVSGHTEANLIKKL